MISTRVQTTIVNSMASSADAGAGIALRKKKIAGIEDIPENATASKKEQPSTSADDVGYAPNKF